MILSIVFHGFEPISATSAKWLAQGFKQHLYIYILHQVLLNHVNVAHD